MTAWCHFDTLFLNQEDHHCQATLPVERPTPVSGFLHAGTLHHTRLSGEAYNCCTGFLRLYFEGTGFVLSTILADVRHAPTMTDGATCVVTSDVAALLDDELGDQVSKAPAVLAALLARLEAQPQNSSVVAEQPATGATDDLDAARSSLLDAIVQIERKNATVDGRVASLDTCVGGMAACVLDPPHSFPFAPTLRCTCSPVASTTHTEHADTRSLKNAQS